MKFTLTYSGKLPSASNAKVKHDIRMAIHPQLKELWRTHPALNAKHKWIDSGSPADGEHGVLLTSISGTTYASLVHPYLKLYAELDIVVLRPEEPGAIISQNGDIDNQLKTLFDALRRPVDSSEVPKTWQAPTGEPIIHCLLDDDKLITRVNVEVDRLLKQDIDKHTVEVTIRVTLKGILATWGNLSLTS